MWSPTESLVECWREKAGQPAGYAKDSGAQLTSASAPFCAQGSLGCQLLYSAHAEGSERRGQPPQGKRQQLLPESLPQAIYQ